MMSRTEWTHPISATRSFLTVAVVSRSPDLSAIDAMLGSATLGIAVVDSMSHAYSQIKRLSPDLIVLCLSEDDAAGCRVLSMLALDNDTARIPVWTCMTAPPDGTEAHVASFLVN